MLEKPPLPDESILACLRAEFGLAAGRIEFLPLGADLNTAVYRAETTDGTAWFVKLRSGVFEETSVRLPLYLQQQGISHILAPRIGHCGLPWAELPPYKAMVYPFIGGVDGYRAPLSPAGWAEFGATMRKIHRLLLPPEWRQRIPSENYSPQARETVRAYLQRLDGEEYSEPVAAETAAFLRRQRGEVLRLVERAEQGVRKLQWSSIAALERVLCHTDLHAGNLLIEPNGNFYIVDWDNPLLALKERDLMFIGGGLGFAGLSAEEEMRHFYQGYGAVEIDAAALGYYRAERILEDIAIFCEQLLGSTQGGEDRVRWLGWLKSNFEAGGTIEMVYRTKKAS